MGHNPICFIFHTLTTNLGAVYVGKLIEIGDAYSRFFYNDQTSRVPTNIISKIVLENGTVAFEGGRTYIPSFKADETEPGFTTGQIRGDTPIVDNSEKSLQIRSVEALEKIAATQTFFLSTQLS